MCDGYISIYDSSKEGNIGGGDFLGLCKNIIAFSEHQMAVHQDFALVLAELALLLAEMVLVLTALELILTALVLVQCTDRTGTGTNSTGLYQFRWS